MTNDEHTVVFGDDGSAASDLAWLWLNSHRWPGWRLDVLHARVPAFGAQVPPDRVSPHPSDAPPPRPLFDESEFSRVDHLVAEDDPRTALASCKDAAVMVLGPHGHAIPVLPHLGSTTEWLLLSPPAPLAVIRSGRPTRRALVCVDGSAGAEAASRAFAALPWIGQVEVTLLGVDDGRADLGALEKARARFEPRAGTVQVRSDAGKPTRVILTEIHQGDYDLAVLGTRGHTGLAQLLLGSTASAIVRAAPCSAFVAAP
jgi:nucleotide-binding universal stress UspA family protein